MSGRPALCFNGAADGLVLPANPIADWAQFTIEALIRPDGSGEPEQRFLHIEDERTRRLLLETRLQPARGWALDTFIYTSPDMNRVLLDREKLHPTDSWHWVAPSFDGKTMRHYVDGTAELDGSIEFGPIMQGRTSLGVRLNQRSWYKGCISEIRFTPRVLRNSELMTEIPH